MLSPINIHYIVWIANVLVLLIFRWSTHYVLLLRSGWGSLLLRIFKSVLTWARCRLGRSTEVFGDHKALQHQLVLGDDFRQIFLIICVALTLYQLLFVFLLFGLALRWSNFLEIINVFEVFSRHGMLSASWCFNYFEILYFSNLLLEVWHFVWHIWSLINDLESLIRKVRPACVINNVHVPLLRCFALSTLLRSYCIELNFHIELVVWSYCRWLRFDQLCFSLFSWLCRKDLNDLCSFLLLLTLLFCCLLELEATLLDLILVLRAWPIIAQRPSIL